MVFIFLAYFTLYNGLSLKLSLQNMFMNKVHAVLSSRLFSLAHTPFCGLVQSPVC